LSHTNPRRGRTNQHTSVGSAGASAISKICRPVISVGKRSADLSVARDLDLQNEAIRPPARGTGGMGANQAGGVIRARRARARMLEVCRSVHSQGNRSGVLSETSADSSSSHESSTRTNQHGRVGSHPASGISESADRDLGRQTFSRISPLLAISIFRMKPSDRRRVAPVVWAPTRRVVSSERGVLER